MILLIDNYDSFTYNLVDYFNQLNCQVEVKRNDVNLNELCSKKYAGVVLSPGPESPDSANNLMSALAFYMGQVPLLGICLGHQAIALHLGAELAQAKYPMHGKISSIAVGESVLFKCLPSAFDVVRYHSLIIKDWSDVIHPTAFTEDKELMAFDTDPELKAHGLQFHPEAILTQYGLDMLRNWLTFYNIV